MTAPDFFDTSPIISNSHVSTWVPRGFAVVHAEGTGTGLSTGCPTTGDPFETLGPKAVIDWLNGRAKAFTAQVGGTEVPATWTTGKVGMIGTSYNGTLPIGVATTGVEGLEAIVPISAISSWYDYYRANGMVRAPGGFQGEDADVLAEYTYTRPDQAICRPVIADIAAKQDRVTGDYTPFWDARNYMNDIDNVARRVAGGARQQRLERDDEARVRVLQRAQGARCAAHALLAPGRARRLAAAHPHEPLVQPLPVGPPERRRERPEGVGRPRGPELPEPDAISRVAGSRRGSRDAQLQPGTGSRLGS